MCDPKTLGMGWMTVVAVSTTPVFVPAGDWEDAAGVTSAKGWGEVRGRNGSAQAVPAAQVANDVRQPGTVTTVGPTMSTDGSYDPNGNTSVATGSAKYIRPGWNVSLATGSVLASMSLCGVIQLLSV